MHRGRLEMNDLTLTTMAPMKGSLPESLDLWTSWIIGLGAHAAASGASADLTRRGAAR
jgi:hypothetical protein